MATLGAYTGLPGMGPTAESTENAFLWGPDSWILLKSIVIDSAATDSGSTPTTDLRPGLVMGQVTSTKRYKAYSPTATTGEQIAEGVLFHGVRMLRPIDATADHQLAQLVVAAPVKGGSLFGVDNFARAHMHGRFIFDDLLVGNQSGWKDVVAKTADYTVVAADNNTIFTNRGAAGAVNFTLPAIAKGLRYRFCVEADQNVTITAATADTLVVFNDAAADSIAFSTVAERIGGAFEIYANDNASKWLVFVMLGAETQTPTIAT